MNLKTWLASLSTLPVLTDFLPDKPDDCIRVRGYGGTPLPHLGKDNRSVQFLFRATDAAVAHDAAWSVYRALDPPPVVTEAGGGKYIVRPKQPPFFLQRDVSSRSEYVFNASILGAPD